MPKYSGSTVARIKTAGGVFNLGAQAAKVPAPIARWNFTEPSAPWLSTAGDLPLTQGAAVLVTRESTPWGFGVANPSTGFLRHAAAGTSRLNVATTTGKFTWAAWVKTADTDVGYIMGCWDETGGKRSWGAFYDLPGYGGNERVNTHVSRLGGASPGYPFSRDLAASSQQFVRGQWTFMSGTYDGKQAISYVDGSGQAYLNYTDIQSNTYNKNPYSYPDGLNPAPVEFTMFANLIPSGYKNIAVASIALPQFWNVCLTPQQMMSLYLSQKV